MYACMHVCMYVCACTDVGCYVEVRPSYLRRPLLLRYRILSGTCTHTVDVTLHDLLMYTRRQLMQRYQEL